MRIALIRHLPPLIAAGTCYGRLDIPARPPQALEITRLRDAIGDRPVHSSPALRCRDLAQHLGTPILDPRLREFDFGDWEGVLWASLPRAALDRWAADPWGFAAPGGETMRGFARRLGDFAASLRATGRDGDAAVVSHGGPLRLLPALLRDEPPDLLAPAPAFGSLTWVQASAAANVSTMPPTS